MPTDPTYPYRRGGHTDALPAALPVPDFSGHPIPEAWARFADLLLRRGFPVHFEKRGLVLSPGNFEKDVEEFHRITPERIYPRNQNGNPLRVFHGNQEITQLFIEENPERQTWESFWWETLEACERHGGYTWLKLGRNQGNRNMLAWEFFKETAFGARPPIAGLEPGAALLVKVLPWLSVCTLMCCHGHQHPEKERQFYLLFASRFYGQWFEHILNRLFLLPRRGLKVEFIYREESENDPETWMILHLNVRPTKSSRTWLFDTIQRIARRFFDPELCRAIREAKNAAATPDDLAPALHRALEGTPKTHLPDYHECHEYRDHHGHSQLTLGL